MKVGAPFYTSGCSIPSPSPRVQCVWPQRERESRARDSIFSQESLLPMKGGLLWLCNLHLYRPSRSPSASTQPTILPCGPGGFAWLLTPCWRQCTGNKVVTWTLKRQRKYRMKKGVKMELGSASWRPKTCEGHMQR